jgi:hypothetical protein
LDERLGNMKKPISAGLLFVALVVVLVGKGHAEEATDWKERFLKESPLRWQDYKDMKILQGSFVSSAMMGDKTVHQSRLEFKQNKTCALVSTQRLQSNGQPAVLNATNARYGFQLKRLTPGKPWAITGQNLNLKDGYKLSRTAPAEAVQNWLSHPFTLDGTAFTRLPVLVKDPDFSVQGANPVVRDGKALVEVHFTSKPKRFEAGQLAGAWMPVRGGRIVFDPERYWVIHECEIQLQRSPQEHDATDSVVGTFEYTDGKKKIPIPRRITRKWAVMGTKSTEDFDLSEREDVPDDEFTLSAYGLPEPVEMQAQAPVRWYIWAAASGAVCLSLGAVLRWRGKRGVS